MADTQIGCECNI